jgi:hypothetical protein
VERRIEANVEIEAPAARIWVLLKPTVVAGRPERELRRLGRLLVPGSSTASIIFYANPSETARPA